jgi:hypothetical protein
MQKPGAVATGGYHTKLNRHKNLDSTFSQAYSFGTPKHICYILHRLSVSRAQGYDQRLAK